MSNIPKPEDEKNLEFDIRYQPDMVLSGSLDATVPEMNNLQLELGDETYDLLGAQSGDQIPELLSEDLTSAEEGKVLTVVEDDSGDTPVYNAEWADAPSGLPEITNSDEGKVLTVVDNSGTLEAEWAEPSGGGVLVTITASGQTIVADASYNDVITALESGSNVMFFVDASIFGEAGNTAVFYPVKYGAGASVYGVQIGGAISGAFAVLILTASTADDPLTGSME